MSRVRSLLPTTPHGASSGAELVTSDGRSLALVSAQLRGEAQGGIARLVLEQRFENTYDELLRVTYRMPLPADGAVSGYEFEIGERIVKGVVDKKHAARERFERAIVEGRTAALLEQERADIFTQQIGNIPPREAIVAKITIDQRLVWLPEGEWELRFPTVIGPRYIGSADTAADVRATHIKVTDQPLKARIAIEIAIRDAITAGAKPSSPSHSLNRRADGVIELTAGARLDRDIVMRWPVTAPAPGLSLATARLGEGDAYGLLTIVPPSPQARMAPVPRDLIVLLDTSGSMSGGPLDKAKQVIALMIDSLAEHDRLELIEFSNEPRRWKDEPIVATGKAKAEAIKWVRSREADGATEMRAAVIEAMQTLRIGAQRQIVLVTDGYVGGEHQILEAMQRGMPKSCRLHVLGVGSAVNRSLATTLSRAGRGAEVIVGIDEDAERGAKRLLDRTRQPMLTNVEIAGSALLRHAPEQVPDVFEGAPLVAALALRPDGGELVVRGQLSTGTWEQRLTVAAKRAGDGNQAICALYGRERVADVESNAMFASTDGEIEDLGLMFQIATRMTSWVAVDETRRHTGPSRDQLIPQELPHGTKAEAFGLRSASGATAPMQAQFEAGMDLDEDFADEKSSIVAAAPRSMMIDRSASYGDAPEETTALGGSFDDAPGNEFESEEPTGQVAGELSRATRAGGLGGASPLGGRPGTTPPPAMRRSAPRPAPAAPGGPPRPTEAAPMPKREEALKEDDGDASYAPVERSVAAPPRAAAPTAPPPAQPAKPALPATRPGAAVPPAKTAFAPVAKPAPDLKPVEPIAEPEGEAGEAELETSRIVPAQQAIAPQPGYAPSAGKRARTADEPFAPTSERQAAPPAGYSPSRKRDALAIPSEDKVAPKQKQKSVSKQLAKWALAVIAAILLALLLWRLLA